MTESQKKYGFWQYTVRQEHNAIYRTFNTEREMEQAKDIIELSYDRSQIWSYTKP